MRLKDDEVEFLHASAGSAGTGVSRLSPGRRLELEGKFKRRGLLSDGVLTRHGQKLLKKNPLPTIEQAAEERPAAGTEAALEMDAETLADSIVETDENERRHDGSDIQGPAGKRVD